jgi:hypothetical protein
LPVPKGVHTKYRALVENRIKRGYMSYLSQNLNIETYMSALRKVEAESGVSAMKITFRPRRPLFELHRQLSKKK